MVRQNRSGVTIDATLRKTFRPKVLPLTANRLRSSLLNRIRLPLSFVLRFRFSSWM